MADRIPLASPGRIAEIGSSDRLVAAGLVTSGTLTLEDSSGGPYTLATIVAGGIGGSTGATDEALLRANGVGGATAQASPITVSDAGLISGGLVGARLVPQVLHPGGGDNDTLYWTTSGDIYIGNARIALAYEILTPTYTTPTALAARADDYGPTGWDTTTHVRQGVTGDQSISGFATVIPVSGDLPVRTKYLLNISTTNTLTLLHDSSFSLSDHRIRCPGGVDLVMPPSSGVTIVQEPSPGPIWRVVSIGDTGGGGGSIGGSTGATDNRVLRADGTGGATLQASPVNIDDAGAVTGVTTLTASGALSGSNLSGTNTGDQTITLTGDVTGTGTGSFAATIANDAVTFAKIQNVAADKLLGRGNGGGTGDTQEITLGTNLSMTGSTLNAAGGGGGIGGTLGAVDNRVPRSDGAGGVTLQASALTVEDTGSTLIASTVADTGLVTSLSATGANGALTQIYSGTRNPEGLVTALPGAIYYRVSGTSSRAYQLRSSASANTPWVELTAGVLSAAKRTTGALIASSSFIGFDLETKATVAEYWTFDGAGTWLCNRAHTARMDARLSFFSTASGTGQVLMEIVKGVGGVFATVVQAQRSAAEQATDLYTSMSAEGFFTFAVNDQVRLYVTNYGGSPNTIANMTTMSIHYVGE